MKRSSLIFIIIGLLTLYMVVGAEEGLAGPSSDIKPPEISIVSPLRNSETDTGMPWIEVLAADSGSGIDQKTIRLLLDGVDVTYKAIIENTDVTGQAQEKPWRVRYRSELPLDNGRHSAEFIVRDLAGNLASAKWAFQVNNLKEAGPGIGGTNTFRADLKPVETFEETLELQGRFPLENGSIRFQTRLSATDYPEFDPDYAWNGINFDIDDTNLGWYGPQSRLVAGYVGMPLDYSLLEVGTEIKGEVLSGETPETGGTLNWAIFSGEVSSSFGLGISIYNISGACGEWEKESGTGWKAFCLRLDDGDPYDFYGFQGCNSFGNAGLIRFDMVHGGSPDGSSGNRFSLKADFPIRSAPVGLTIDWIQPDYPLAGTSPTLSTGRRGTEQVALYGEIPLNPGQWLSLNLTSNRDNLDGSLAYTERQEEFSAELRGSAKNGFQYHVSYQGDYRQSDGVPEGVIHYRGDYLDFEVEQEFGKSKVQGSASWNRVIQSSAENDSFQTNRVFAAWTRSMEFANLTSSLQWTDQQWANDDGNRTFDLRVTLDKLLNPDVARSALAIFHRISADRIDGFLTRTVTDGLELSLYFKTDEFSTVSLVMSYSLWDKNASVSTEGDSNAINLIWTSKF